METNLQDAEVLAETLFGITGTASPLPAEYGANFRIDTPAGSYVLKLPPQGADPLELDLQNAALQRAAGAELGFMVPQPVVGADDSLLPSRPDGSGFARMLTWVRGTPYLDAGRPPELAAAIGRSAASLSGALADLIHAAAVRGLSWDLMDAPSTIEANAAAIAESHRRTMVQDIGHHFTRDVRPRMLDLPWQIIHNDINDLNLLIDRGEVVGLIDFGDVLAGPRVIDAAVAATYAMLDQNDPLAVGRDVIAGFDEVACLTAVEKALVFDLIRTRLAISVVLSAARRDPSNPHLSVSETDAWDLLDRLESVDPTVGAALLAGTQLPKAPDLEAARHATLGPSLTLAYDSPLVIVRGSGTHLYDDRGRRYIDCVNNICHVGHCHPRVVAAAAAQTSRLNTNTRYLHPGIVEYGRRLTRLLPPGLDICYFVNSGSEANELAVRLARAHTGRHPIAVLDHAYHGNTSTLVAISPYKFNGPGGAGRAPWVTVLPLPDPYRSEFSGPDAARTYTAAIGPLLTAAQPAALIAESVAGVAGQIIPAAGTLAAAYDAARAEGAVVIADEVQVGFGRVGAAFWGFELAGVTPDIVTLGKPMGNGHPMGAVITTRAIALSFDNGMEYFSSFGGNPVSAAIGIAVLDVIEDEQLQARAAAQGTLLMQLLEDVARHDDRIGDVRGSGLFIGIELVDSRAGRRADPSLAKALVEHAKAHGVLLSTDGPHHNVIKIKPPLVFGPEEAHRLVAVIASGLST